MWEVESKKERYLQLCLPVKLPQPHPARGCERGLEPRSLCTLTCTGHMYHGPAILLILFLSPVELISLLPLVYVRLLSFYLLFSNAERFNYMSIKKTLFLFLVISSKK